MKRVKTAPMRRGVAGAAAALVAATTGIAYAPAAPRPPGVAQTRTAQTPTAQTPTPQARARTSRAQTRTAQTRTAQTGTAQTGTARTAGFIGERLMVGRAATGQEWVRVPGALSLPRTYRLSLHGQYQSTDYYCVPASSAMSLSTFGVKVGQDTLAKMMKTTAKGTGGNNAAKVIDGYIHPRRYDDKLVGDVVDHPGVLMDRVAYDVGALRRAPVIQVWMERLPWNKGKVGGQWIGHAITAYGYDRSAGTVTVFDPWRPTGGAHTLPVSALARSLQAGAGMHYISRL